MSDDTLKRVHITIITTQASDVSWFINHYEAHELVRYIYHKPSLIQPLFLGVSERFLVGFTVPSRIR